MKFYPWVACRASGIKSRAWVVKKLENSGRVLGFLVPGSISSLTVFLNAEKIERFRDNIKKSFRLVHDVDVITTAANLCGTLMSHQV